MKKEVSVNVRKKNVYVLPAFFLCVEARATYTNPQRNFAPRYCIMSVVSRAHTLHRLEYDVKY